MCSGRGRQALLLNTRKREECARFKIIAKRFYFGFQLEQETPTCVHAALHRAPTYSNNQHNIIREYNQFPLALFTYERIFRCIHFFFFFATFIFRTKWLSKQRFEQKEETKSRNFTNSNITTNIWFVSFSASELTAPSRLFFSDCNLWLLYSSGNFGESLRSMQIIKISRIHSIDQSIVCTSFITSELFEATIDSCDWPRSFIGDTWCPSNLVESFIWFSFARSHCGESFGTCQMRGMLIWLIKWIHSRRFHRFGRMQRQRRAALFTFVRFIQSQDVYCLAFVPLSICIVKISFVESTNSIYCMWWRMSWKAERSIHGPMLIPMIMIM